MEIEREFVSTVFIVQDSRVLLNFNNKCKIWVPVGGHIEKNELPCQSVIREAKEESGLDIELVNPYQSLGSSNMIQPVILKLDHVRDNHKHMNLNYFGKVIGGLFKEISDDGAPSKWFSKEELMNTTTEELPENIREMALIALRDVE